MPNTVSKKEKAYQAIRQAIIIRQLEPAKNYSITELSEAFEVGKTPAREALVILASEGFIDPIPRSGYQVKSLSNRKGYDLNLEFHLTPLTSLQVRILILLGLSATVYTRPA